MPRQRVSCFGSSGSLFVRIVNHYYWVSLLDARFFCSMYFSSHLSTNFVVLFCPSPSFSVPYTQGSKAGLVFPFPTTLRSFFFSRKYFSYFLLCRLASPICYEVRGQTRLFYIALLEEPHTQPKIYFESLHNHDLTRNSWARCSAT